MAEDDKRLDVLEDELKVLKGEIRRTLVDLRAHLMREGSPLNEGAFSRRGAPPRQEPREESPAIRQEVAATVLVDPQSLLQTEQAEMGSPGVIAGNFVLGVRSATEADAGAGAAPAATAVAPGGAGAPVGRPQYPPPAGVETPARESPPQQEVEVEEEYILERGGPERVGVHIHQAAPAMGPPERVPQARHRRGEDQMPRSGRRHDDEDWDEEVARSDRSRHKEGQPHSRAGPHYPPDGRGNSRYEEEEGEAEYYPREREPARQNGRGSRVYDEYLDLMAETEELYPGDDDPTQHPLDVNLLASLVRWASVARQRVGEQRLADILELYFQSGHCYPGLQELLKHIASMVDDVPSGVSESAEECIDLLAHLHGILTGAHPIARVPRMKLNGPGRHLLPRSTPATSAGR